MFKKSLFVIVFNNRVLRSIIFKEIKLIHNNRLENNRVFKWKQLVLKPNILLHYRYFQHYKNYFYTSSFISNILNKNIIKESIIIIISQIESLELLEFTFNQLKEVLLRNHQNEGIKQQQELIVQSLFDIAINQISTTGRLDMLQYILKFNGDDYIFKGIGLNLFRNVVSAGHVHILEYLKTTYLNNIKEDFNISSLQILPLKDIAARYNHLDVLVWLHQHDSKVKFNCSERVLPFAVLNGNREMVEWIIKNCTYCYFQNCMDIASSNGHIDLVKYLHTIPTEKCTSNAITTASENGHLEVVRFLCTNRSEINRAVADYAIKFAAKKNHSEIVHYLKGFTDTI